MGEQGLRIMTDYYNYNNVKVKVNNSGILANSASFSLTNQLSKTSRVNKVGGNEYVAEQGANGTLSLSYYVDANVGDPFNDPNAKPGQKTFSIDMGGLTLNSGFLTSYSWSANPHGILMVNANFSFFEDFGGTFAPTVLEDGDRDWYKLSDLAVSLEGIDVSSKIVSLSYAEEHGFQPVYDISGVAPHEMREGLKAKSLQMDTYNITEAIPYAGKNVSVGISVRGQPSVWKVNGTLMTKTLDISFGQKVISVLNIEEDGYGGAPVLRESNTGGVKKAGEYWYIYGYNLLDTTVVYFNNNIRTNEFTTDTTSDNGNDSYIKIKIPRFAQSGPIRVITPYGEAAHEQRAGGAPIDANIDPTYIP